MTLATSGELLAPGAPPRTGGIPLFVPNLEGREWEYVRECLDTGWVSSAGPFVERLEQAVAEAVGARHAVATVSGTAALHLALLVAGVGPDDVVLVPSLSFIAPANAVRYVGARPVFVDVEPSYWQMDAEQVFDRLSGAARVGDALYDVATRRRIGAVLPVHALGHPVDLDPIVAICRANGIPVIEDAAESLGATYHGRPVGRLGDAACFSFNGNKVVTTGGGGMFVTDREDWALRARYLSTQAKDDALEYIHGAVGYNYRLSNVLAAIGVAQMERLDRLVEAKRAIARRYAAGLAGIPGVTPMREAPWARSTFWMYTVMIDEAAFGLAARSLLRVLAEAGIQARPLWQPLHLSPAHDAAPGRCPVAEELHRRGLSLPCSAGLAPDEQDRVIETIRAAARGGAAS